MYRPSDTFSDENVNTSFINTTGATSGAGTAYPSGAHEFTPVLVEIVWLDLYFSVWCFVDRCSSPSLMAIVFSVRLRLTDSDYPFGIFKLFLVCKTRFWHKVQ